MPRIHYWELSNYNGGNLIGKWFDLEDVTEAEHSQERAEWLEELTNSTGELCEEWIVGDVEDVPSEYVSEWSISSEFFELEEAVQTSGLDRAVFLAGISLGIPISSIEDAYYGEYRSDTELAEAYIDSTGMLSDVPDSIANYFDYEAFGRDLAMDFSESNGHYFSSDW